jgi:hypothetical protein
MNYSRTIFVHFHDVMSLFNISVKQVETNDIQITEIKLPFSKLIKAFVNG